MRQHRRATIQDLRQAIDCLPRDTKLAMLAGMRQNDIIVGAYTDGDGICPMLAAHRCGGRTSFIAFAKAWDRFAFRGTRVKLARRATERELLILRTHLEDSVLESEHQATNLAVAVDEHVALVGHRATHDERPEEPVVDLAAAVAAHEALVAHRCQREAAATIDETAGPPNGKVRPGDPDRSGELRNRPGWAWTRVVRRYDDYKRALDWLEAEHQALSERERELELVSQ